MAGYQRVIFNGTPGERWRNDTGRIQYQLLVNWASTCGVCAQYDHAVGPIWPLPYHRNCRCRQIAIVPAGLAEPFVDFRDIAAGLDDEGKRKLVGASNYKLITDGVVKWSDVVTPHRVRALHEVAAIKKLTVDRMTAAGVRPDLAAKAWATVNTPEHQLVEARRRELVKALEGAGLDRSTIAGLAADGLAARIGVVAPGGRRQALPGIAPEERLKRFLLTWTPPRKRPPKPPEPKPEPETPPEPERTDDADADPE